jgi:hypothetical protein
MKAPCRSLLFLRHSQFDQNIMPAAKVRKVTIAPSTYDFFHLPALLQEHIRMSENTRETLHPQELIAIKSLFILYNFSQLQDPRKRHEKKNNRCLKDFRDRLFRKFVRAFHSSRNRQGAV